MKFITETGSLYELDLEGKRVRRLIGVADPTPRQGKDGEWRYFESCSAIKIGREAYFIWQVDPTEDGLVARTTGTSKVKTILEGYSL